MEDAEKWLFGSSPLDPTKAYDRGVLREGLVKLIAKADAKQLSEIAAVLIQRNSTFIALLLRRWVEIPYECQLRALKGLASHRTLSKEFISTRIILTRELLEALAPMQCVKILELLLSNDKTVYKFTQQDLDTALFPLLTTDPERIQKIKLEWQRRTQLPPEAQMKDIVIAGFYKWFLANPQTLSQAIKDGFKGVDMMSRDALIDAYERFK